VDVRRTDGAVRYIGQTGTDADPCNGCVTVAVPEGYNAQLEPAR